MPINAYLCVDIINPLPQLHNILKFLLLQRSHLPFSFASKSQTPRQWNHLILTEALLISSSSYSQTYKNIFHLIPYIRNVGLTWWFSSKESTFQCRRCGFNPWVGKIPCKRKWQPTQYSCLGNPINRGAWWATVHRVTESDTTEVTELAHTHTHGALRGDRTAKGEHRTEKACIQNQKMNDILLPRCREDPAVSPPTSTHTQNLHE